MPGAPSPARYVTPSRLSPSVIDRRARAGVLDQRGQPVVEAEPVAHDQVGARDPLDVGRRGVEGVDLAALGDEAVDVDPRPADLRDHVGQHRRRRDDADGVGIRGRGGLRSVDPRAPQPAITSTVSTAERAEPEPRTGGGSCVRRCRRRPRGTRPQMPNSSRRCDVTVNERRSPTSARTAPRPRSSMSCDRPQRVQIAWWWCAGSGRSRRRRARRRGGRPARRAGGPRTRRARGRSSPARSAAAGGARRREVGGREVALARGDEPGDRTARLGQPVAGVVEGGDQRLGLRSRDGLQRDGDGARRRASIPRGPSTSASRNMPVWTSTIVAPLATSSQYER